MIKAATTASAQTERITIASVPVPDFAIALSNSELPMST
jgi:hypothetical protein